MSKAILALTALTDATIVLGLYLSDRYSPNKSIIILQLFLDGLSISEIIRQASGLKGGRKYNDTLNRINVIVR